MKVLVPIYQPEVVDPIVRRVTINVVDQFFPGILSVYQHPDNAMNHKISSLDTHPKISNSRMWRTGGATSSVALPRSGIPPSEYPVFRVIGKQLPKRLLRR